MHADEVVRVLETLEDANVRVWVDGGWAIDALAGEQTREHTDLDLALDERDLDAAVRAVQVLGYEEDVAASPGRPARVVLLNADGLQIDFHPLAFDGHGNGWQQLSPTGRSWGLYPAEDLQERGTVAGSPVRCTSAALQHRFRMAYEWSERDEHFMRVLHERFSLPIPPRRPT
jgi:lincosamide nucleotidyltransferase A/C/D/E